MRSLSLAVPMLLLALGAIAGDASARSRCDGNFEFIHGSWIATPSCQMHEANKVARKMHKRLSEHPSGSNEESPTEFCRGNPDIRVSTFCAAYKD